MGDCRLDRERLLHLTEIDKVLKPGRKAEIAVHRLGDPCIPARILLMALHHRRRDIAVGRFRKPSNDIHRGIGLKAELGTETRRDIAVVIKIAPLMPDGPEMHVARTVVMPGVAEIQRACRGA